MFGQELPSPCILVSIESKSVSTSLWVINYFPSCNPSLTNKPLSALSILPWKVLRQTIFLSSTSSNLHDSDPPCYVHCNEPTSFLPYSRSTRAVSSHELLLCGTNTQIDTFPIITVLTCSSLGLTVIFTTYPYKVCPYSVTPTSNGTCALYRVNITLKKYKIDYFLRPNSYFSLKMLGGLNF